MENTRVLSIWTKMLRTGIMWAVCGALVTVGIFAMNNNGNVSDFRGHGWGLAFIAMVAAAPGDILAAALEIPLRGYANKVFMLTFYVVANALLCCVAGGGIALIIHGLRREHVDVVRNKEL